MKPNFVAALSLLGNQVTLDYETFSTLEEYTCCSYGSNRKNNKLRFQTFTQKNKREEKYVHLAMLPPYRNSFLLHTQRANRALTLMKSENTAIVQGQPLQDWLGCKWQHHLGK